MGTLEKIARKGKEIAVLTGLTSSAFLYGCETPQDTRAIGVLFGLAAANSNNNMTYDQRVGAAIIGGALENQARDQAQIQAAREGRSNINVNIPQQQYSQPQTNYNSNKQDDGSFISIKNIFDQEVYKLEHKQRGLITFLWEDNGDHQMDRREDKYFLSDNFIEGDQIVLALKSEKGDSVVITDGGGNLLGKVKDICFETPFPFVTRFFIIPTETLKRKDNIEVLKNKTREYDFQLINQNNLILSHKISVKYK